MLTSAKRDTAAARRFFIRALRQVSGPPREVTADRAPAYVGVLDGLLPAALPLAERTATTAWKPITTG